MKTKHWKFDRLPEDVREQILANGERINKNQKNEKRIRNKKIVREFKKLKRKYSFMEWGYQKRILAKLAQRFCLCTTAVKNIIVKAEAFR